MINEKAPHRYSACGAYLVWGLITNERKLIETSFVLRSLVKLAKSFCLFLCKLLVPKMIGILVLQEKKRRISDKDDKGDCYCYPYDNLEYCVHMPLDTFEVGQLELMN